MYCLLLCIISITHHLGIFALAVLRCRWAGRIWEFVGLFEGFLEQGARGCATRVWPFGVRSIRATRLAILILLGVLLLDMLLLGMLLLIVLLLDMLLPGMLLLMVLLLDKPLLGRKAPAWTATGTAASAGITISVTTTVWAATQTTRITVSTSPIGWVTGP